MITIRHAIVLSVLMSPFIPATSSGQAASPENLLRRVDSLERHAADLERRVRELEARLKTAPAEARPAPAPGNWQEVANWRRLRRGMKEDEVRALLGEPTRVHALGSRTYWYWSGSSSAAELYFDDSRVAGWSEPRR